MTAGDALLVLQWSNPFGAASDDYDLCTMPDGIDFDPPNATNLSIVCSTREQASGLFPDPVEVLGLNCTPNVGSDTCSGIHAKILRFCPDGCTSATDPTPQILEVFLIGPIELVEAAEEIEADSVFGHPAVPGVISTAAINADDPGNDDIASYSSQGPSTICSSFPCTSPVLRPTPAITGIDNVTVSPAGISSPFAGTSASAPHLAAIAALMLEADPTLTPAEVLAALQSTATDRGTAGFDNTYGAGLADALAAVNSVTLPDLIVPGLSGPATGTVGGSINVSATVENQGTAAAGAFDVAFYFSIDGVFDAGDTPSATTCSYGGLGAGATDSTTCSSVAVDVPVSLTGGTYTLFANVDDADAVAESDETNNTRAADSGTVMVMEPDGTVIFADGFESGALPPSWIPFGGVTAAVTAGAALTGSFGLELSGGSGLPGVLRDIGGLTPGQNYEVSVFVRSLPGSGAAFLWLNDTTGANASIFLPAPGVSTYRRIKLDYRANATGTVRVHLLFEAGLGAVEWDALTVVKKSVQEYGFESGALAPWIPFGGVTAAMTVGAARTGSFGLELSGGSGLPGVLRDIGGLTPGQNYEVKVYVRSPPGSGAAFLWLNDTTGANASIFLPAPGDASYRPIKLDYQANATGAVRIHLLFEGAPGTAEWDDLSVEPKSTLEYGFESGGLAPWVPFGGVTAVVTAGAARTGSFGLELSGGSGLPGVLRDVGGLTPGQNYEVKVYVRSPPGSGAAFLWLNDTTGANASIFLPAPGDASYRPIKLDYQAKGS